jgi:hypothetical protein
VSDFSIAVAAMSNGAREKKKEEDELRILMLIEEVDKHIK